MTFYAFLFAFMEYNVTDGSIFCWQWVQGWCQWSSHYFASIKYYSFHSWFLRIRNLRRRSRDFRVEWSKYSIKYFKQIHHITTGLQFCCVCSTLALDCMMTTIGLNNLYVEMEGLLMRQHKRDLNYIYLIIGPMSIQNWSQYIHEGDSYVFLHLSKPYLWLWMPWLLYDIYPVAPCICMWLPFCIMGIDIWLIVFSEGWPEDCGWLFASRWKCIFDWFVGPFNGCCY